MADLSEQEITYKKSLFRCPICGHLVGIDEKGHTNIFSIIKLRKHVKNCRNKPRVKPSDDDRERE